MDRNEKQNKNSHITIHKDSTDGAWEINYIVMGPYGTLLGNLLLNIKDAQKKEECDRVVLDFTRWML